MPQEDENFEQSMRSLRNMVGLACCLISGALIVLAYGDWLMFVALILLYWPFSVAMDLGSRRDWRGRARRALNRMNVLLVVDLLVGGLVALGPVLIARSLALEIGPAALALVLFAALAALWLEPAWQGVSVVGALALFEYFIVPPAGSFVFRSVQDAFAFGLAACAVVVMAWGARRLAALSSHRV